MDSFFIATTIGGGSQFAIMEVPASEKPEKGEYMLSPDCVKANLDSKRFKDMTEFATNAYRRLYVLRDDLEQLENY